MIYSTNTWECFVCCISDFDKLSIVFWLKIHFSIIRTIPFTINVNYSRSWMLNAHHESFSTSSLSFGQIIENLFYLKHLRKWSVSSFQFPGIPMIINFFVNKWTLIMNLKTSDRTLNIEQSIKVVANIFVV